MASQMKCGSCGFKSDDSSRRIRAWGGGGFFRMAYFKIPRQVDVEICVYCKQLYLRAKFIKVKYTSTFNNNCGGLGGLIDLFFHSFMPTVPTLTPCTECILNVSHKYPPYLMYNNRTVSIY